MMGFKQAYDAIIDHRAASMQLPTFKASERGWKWMFIWLFVPFFTSFGWLLLVSLVLSVPYVTEPSLVQLLTDPWLYIAVLPAVAAMLWLGIVLGRVDTLAKRRLR